MSALQIKPGEYVLYRGERYEISRVLDLETVLARRSGTGEIQRLSITDLVPETADDEATAEPRADLDLSVVADTDWAEAERRLGLIRPLLDRVIRTREAVEAHGKENGVHWTTLYKWRRRYERSGRTSSLLPHKPSGGRGRSRLEPEIEAVIKDVVENRYLSRDRWPLLKVIEEVGRLCTNAKLRRPHPNTVRRRVEAISDALKLERRHGKRAAREKYGSVGKAAVDADGPLALVEIDHTQVDVMLVDEEIRLPIGRPWLTLVIDVFSRVILGFYIGLDPPSSLSVGLALTHAILPKDRWLAKLGLTFAYPFWGVPRMIVVDNAAEFHGVMLERACDEHRITIQWRRLARPEDGPHVERVLGTFTKKFHAIPGTTYSNVREKGNYDSEAKAVMTLEEFERWFTILVATDYHQNVHSRTRQVPKKRYEAGIFGTDGRAGTGLPERIIDEDRLRLDFTPLVERTIQRTGVQIDLMTYDADVLKLYRDAKDPDNPLARRKFVFRRDPRDISVIYFLDPETNRYHRVPARDLSRPSISLWEWKESTRYARRAGQAQVDEDVIWDGRNQLRAQEEESDRKTKEAKKARRAAERKRHHARTERPSLAAPGTGGSENEAVEGADEAPATPENPVEIVPFPRDVLPPRSY